jgi:outer membrane protein assembly factor BamB
MATIDSLSRITEGQMVGKRFTRRTLVSGAGLAGFALATRSPAIMARQTPAPAVSGTSFDIVMAGADPANTKRVPGPSPDGVPELGGRIHPGVSFSLGLREEAGMLVQDGVIYARGYPGAGERVLFALDAVTGAERWRVPGVDALLALTPGAAIVERLGRDDAPDTILAMALDGSGTALWQVEARGQGRTLVAADIVIVSTSDGPIAIDAEAGAVAWNRTELELTTALEIAAGDRILVGTEPTEANQVSAWQLDSGEFLWSVTLDRPVQTAPVVAGDAAWVCDPLDLIELDLRTGGERRRIELGRVMPYRGRLALAETTMVVSDISGLSAIDLATGEPRWEYAPRFGTAFELLLAGTTAYLMVKDGASFDASQVVQAIDLDTGEPRWELPAPGSDAPADDIRHMLVTGDRLWLASMNGLRACAFTDEPDPGVSGPVRGNTFASESAGFSYSWTDVWEPGDTDWLLGEDGMRFESADGNALVTQYVEDIDGPASPDEIAWAIAGVQPGHEVSLDPAPIVAAFPRSFGPDTSRLRGLAAADPPDLTGTIPPGAGVALVLAHTVLQPPFDRMLVLIVAVPLRDPATILVFELGTAESLFTERLPSFLAYFEDLTID